MRSALLRLLLLAVALAAFVRGGAFAGDPEPLCSCVTGFGACQHYLRNPAGATDDPCWCDRCASGLAGRRHDGKLPPPGWNPDCWNANRAACYLKRHCAAWGVACSECVKAESCCSAPNKANCPDCGPSSIGPPVGKDFAGRDPRKAVLERLAKEAPLFRKPEDVIVLYSKHFYVVSDVEGLKVRTDAGGTRVITAHEWAHLMLERAEWCRKTWVRTLGELRVTDRPIGLWFAKRETDKRRIAQLYFGTDVGNALIGTASRIADGFVVNGLALSEQRYPGDHGLVLELRHEITHNFLSIWTTQEVRPKSFPQWVYEGLGHWMTRQSPTFADDASYCAPESSGIVGAAGGRAGGQPSWSGKGWELDLQKMAAKSDLAPIEEFLAKTVKGDLSAEDQKRAWSCVHLGLQDFGKPFVRLLVALRKEVDAREAFTTALGMTPSEFDTRWKQRILGVRTSMAGDAPASKPPGGAAAGDRRALQNEDDPATLAARIRQFGTVTDPKTIDAILDQVARPDALVRETAVVTLLKTKDPRCVERIWRHGLGHTDAIVRAYAARVCGRLLLKDAIPRLGELLGDGNWLVRAESALALGAMRHANSMARMREMVESDPSERAQAAAMDALAAFGEDGKRAVPMILKHVKSDRWQLRVTAFQALGAIGSMEAVETLIDRMPFEHGRLLDELRAALRAIVRDDLGTSQDAWKTWWEKEKQRVARENPGALPPRPAVTGKDDEKRKADEERYGGERPKYYGIELAANRVAFVVDTSQSMEIRFDPSPLAMKRLSRTYSQDEKLTIAREEIVQALRRLDARTHFGIVSFGDRARSYKDRLVPATRGNIDDAEGFLRSMPPKGETNYFDALRLVLGLGDEPDVNAQFRDTPDVVTFMTDGAPTRGQITDGDTLLEWFTGLNRFARVKVLTLSFGRVGIDQPLLEQLGARNWGRYVVVEEAR